MVKTFVMFIALINDNSNLMIIKTYQSMLKGEYIYINLKQSHIILHFMYVTHFTIRKLKAFKRDLESYLYVFIQGFDIGLVRSKYFNLKK